jgi:hypothetical protein
VLLFAVFKTEYIGVIKGLLGGLVKTIEEQPASVAFVLDENSQADPDEYWFWDVRGYLVISC